jgi:hypothetical protein
MEYIMHSIKYIAIDSGNNIYSGRTLYDVFQEYQLDCGFPVETLEGMTFYELSQPMKGVVNTSITLTPI